MDCGCADKEALSSKIILNSKRLFDPHAKNSLMIPIICQQLPLEQMLFLYDIRFAINPYDLGKI